MEDYYAILGVPRDATESLIRDAYHEKAKKYHPDVYSGAGGDVIFKRINEAYRTLSHPQRRRQYDFRLKYGTFAYTSDSVRREVEERRERMRREYMRRKMEADQAMADGEQRFNRIVNDALFWSMAVIMSVLLMYSVLDAWINGDFLMLVFSITGVGVGVFAYYQLMVRKKK